MAIEIRDATEKDIGPILIWGETMWNESQFVKYDYDYGHVALTVKDLIKDEDGICFVAVSNGVPVGGFLGKIGHHFFGKCRYAFDLALYVAPEFRKGSLGVRLLKEYIAQAKELGADEITIGNSTGIDEGRVGRLYEALGFTKYGYNYRASVNEVTE